MDRTEYIELCKKCATLPVKNGVKQNIPEELTVICGDTRYYPIGYSLSYDASGNIVHSCTLHDLKAKSITVCELHRVKPYNDGAR